MKKIAFIGSGSIEFTRDLSRDILTFDALRDVEFALMDINEGRLEMSRKCVQKLIDRNGVDARVSTTTDRRTALEGADGVLITILAGGVDIWRHDIEIPMKHGVDLCVGDTRGPAGIFRFLRTFPVMMDIGRDIMRLCPNAIVLNYTNPMAMLVRGLQEVFPEMHLTGLCHSVQGTAEMLASWIGAPMEEIEYICTGINHQAWYVKYEWNGQDAYPMLRRLITENSEYYDKEPVRNEMFLHLDYYVSESSGHNSEYSAWFRKRPDLVEKYCSHGTNWNPGEHAYVLKEYRDREKTWQDDVETWLARTDIKITRGLEYASAIFNAVFGDGEPYRFNGNTRNWGLVENLPHGCCVEVPTVAEQQGTRPQRTPKLPTHLAILTSTNAEIEELAVRASIEGDARMILHALCMDPLTSAVLSLAEIRDMTKALFRQNEQHLPQFRESTRSLSVKPV